LVALANLMRLSLQKAAHANLADAACRKSGFRNFLWRLVALSNFMRLSLQKAAHANLADAACRKSGSG
jgi:hypothetical protein